MNIEAYKATVDDAGLRDMSHFGRFRVSGADAAALLHHLTTNDIKALKPGHGCDAALVSSKARMLDIVSIFRVEAPGPPAFDVVTSPNRRDMFKPHAQKFVLFRQDIKIEEAGAGEAMFGIFGPKAAEVVEELSTLPLIAAHTARLPHPDGWLLWGPEVSLRAQVQAAGRPLLDNETYNALRVEAGIPVAGLEITEEINPWEAGLGSMISLHKGCYNGQEIIARLNTYQKVKQNLRGLSLPYDLPEAEGYTLRAEGRPAGIVTSRAHSPRYGEIGLCYLRSKWQEAGTTVEVWSAGETGEAQAVATVVELPFKVTAPGAP